MSDRLAELRRQRALVQEHLAWLDRELAALLATSPASTPGSDSTRPSLPESKPSTLTPTPRSADSFVVGINTSAPSPSGPAEDTPPAPDALIEQFRFEPEAVKQDVRKGCFLYFAAAFALLIVVVGILYVALSDR